MEKCARIYVAGNRTLIGGAMLRVLGGQGYTQVLREPEPDLTNDAEVDAFFERSRPEYVIVAAGKSGGIALNRRAPATLMTHNMLVAVHLMRAAHRHGAKKLVYVGSSCIYPRLSAQPTPVEALGTGPLEPTSEAYALAKLAGLGLVSAYRREHGAPFIGMIPSNVFGPDDDFAAEDSHVVGALMRRMHDAKRTGAPALTVWGSGTPRRELIYSEDLADACLFLLERYDGDAPVNVGSGSEVSIAELARLVADVVGYSGELLFDPTKPDGAPHKSLDSTPLFSLGWCAKTGLRDALATTYAAAVGAW